MLDDVNRKRFSQWAILSFVAIFALRAIVDDPIQNVAALWVIPVAFAAMAWGIGGGLAMAAAAAAARMGWLAHDDFLGELSLWGWVSRIGTYVIVGLVVGYNRTVIQECAQRLAEHRLAHQLHDRTLQNLIVCRYRLQEAGVDDHCLDEAIADIRHIVSERLGDNVEPGTLRVSETRSG